MPPKKRRARPAGMGKLNSLGIPIAVVEQCLSSKKNHKEMIKSLINEKVTSAESRHELEKEVIYIISLAYFGCTLDGRYLPAELGVVKYSLQCGVMDKLHMYINPGEMPTGARLSVQEHTGKTHLLPEPPNAWGIADMNEVAVRLLSFLGADDEIPPLFTDEETLDIVESMLREILKDCIMDKELYVCPLSELFCIMKQATERHFMNKSTFPSALTAQYILKIDCYAFAIGISCDHHEKELNMLHCALSQATRWAYTISKYCCEHMGIDCVPGIHIPLHLFPSENSASETPSTSGSNLQTKQGTSDNAGTVDKTTKQNPVENLTNQMEKLSASNNEPSFAETWNNEDQNLDLEFPTLSTMSGRGRGYSRGNIRGRGRYSRRR